MLHFIAKHLVKPCRCPICGTKLRLLSYNFVSSMYLDGTPYAKSKHFNPDVIVCRHCQTLCRMKYGADVIHWSKYGETASELLCANDIHHYATSTETKLRALMQCDDYTLQYHRHLAHHFEERKDEKYRQQEIAIIIDAMEQTENGPFCNEYYISHDSFHAIKHLEYKGHMVYDVGRDMLPFPDKLHLIDWVRQSGDFNKATKLIQDFRSSMDNEFRVAYEQFLHLEEQLIAQQDTKSH